MSTEPNNPHNTPIHANPVPLIRVSGSHREMGRQIGEAMREQVNHSIENARKLSLRPCKPFKKTM